MTTTIEPRIDVDALPVNPCPSWCSLQVEHLWDIADGPAGDGRVFRDHEHHISDRVYVSASEVRQPDGASVWWPAQVTVTLSDDTEDLSAEQAYELANELREAALLAQRINREVSK